MTFVLEKPVIIGETVLTALCQNTISGHRSERHTLVTGAKRPVALLIQRGDQLSAFNPNGEAMTLDEMEALYPGVIPDFESSVAG